MALLLLAGWPSRVFSQDANSAPVAEQLAAIQETQASHKVLRDTLWVMIAAFLVFWTQAGFARVEGGLTRAMSTNNFMMNDRALCLRLASGWLARFGMRCSYLGRWCPSLRQNYRWGGAGEVLPKSFDLSDLNPLHDPLSPRWHTLFLSGIFNTPISTRPCLTRVVRRTSSGRRVGGRGTTAW